MTLEEKIKELLTSNGMFDHMADEVMERVKADEANASMEHRWNDAVDDCPSQMLAVLWSSTRRHAVEYIDENLPKAWFRSMFADNIVSPE